MKPLAAALLPLLFAAGAFAQTSVRETPGGARLLFVDGDALRPEPGGQRLLFIDGKTLRPEPGGKTLLFLDNEGNVRPEPGGVRIAYFDKTDHTLRRKPGGEILAWIKHPEIREQNVGGKLLYFLDGPALTSGQLLAVLHRLKPELLKLSEEEIAKKKAEMKAAAKEEESRIADRLFGKFDSLNSNVELFKDAKAEVVEAQAKGLYRVTLTLKNGAKLTGIGVPREVDSKQEIWFAASPKGAFGLGVYEMKGPELDGVWLPMECLSEGKEGAGTEKLKLTKPGNYQIASATLPKTGTAYKGTMQVTRLPTESNVAFEAYMIQWTVDKKKRGGIGFLAKTGPEQAAFVAASGSDTDGMVGRLFHTEASGVHIDFVTTGRATGYLLLDKAKP